MREYVQNTFSNKKFIVGILISLILSILNVIVLFFIGGTIDNNYSILENNYIFIAMGMIIYSIGNSISNYFLFESGNENTFKFRMNFFKHIIHLPQNFFLKNTGSALASIIINDTTYLGNYYSLSFPRFIINIFLFIVFMIALLYINIKLTIIMTALFILTSIVNEIMSRKFELFSNDLQRQVEIIISSLQETFDGVKVIKMSNGEKLIEAKINKKIKKFHEISSNINAYNTLISPIQDIITIVYIFILIALGFNDIKNNVLSIGELTSYVLLLMQINPIIQSLLDFRTNKRSLDGSLKKVKEILTIKPEIELNNYGNLDENYFGTLEKIELINLNYKINNVNILYDINLKVNKGDHFFIVGSSGSGKSTLVNILVGLYRVNSAMMLINNKKIDESKINIYREKFSIAFQDNVIFGGNIRDNLMTGNDKEISENDLVKALITVELYDYEKSPKENLEKIILNGGKNLSGGQKQKLQLARILIQNREVIIFDEASSSIDNLSKTRILKSIKDHFKNKTILIITHNIEDIDQESNVIYMSDGKIIGKGIHKELLKSSHKYFNFITDTYNALEEL